MEIQGAYQIGYTPNLPQSTQHPCFAHLHVMEARGATVDRTVSWEATKDRLIKQVTFQFSNLFPFDLRSAGDQVRALGGGGARTVYCLRELIYTGEARVL